MVLKDWKKQLVKPNRILWTKGKFKPGSGYQDWIHIDKNIDKYALKYADTNKTVYEVGASRKINPKTLNGHFKSYKTKSAALAFVKSYMRKH